MPWLLVRSGLTLAAVAVVRHIDLEGGHALRVGQRHQSELVLPQAGARTGCCCLRSGCCPRHRQLRGLGPGQRRERCRASALGNQGSQWAAAGSHGGCPRAVAPQQGRPDGIEALARLGGVCLCCRRRRRRRLWWCGLGGSVWCSAAVLPMQQRWPDSIKALGWLRGSLRLRWRWGRRRGRGLGVGVWRGCAGCLPRWRSRLDCYGLAGLFDMCCLPDAGCLLPVIDVAAARQRCAVGPLRRCRSNAQVAGVAQLSCSSHPAQGHTDCRSAVLFSLAGRGRPTRLAGWAARRWGAPSLELLAASNTSSNPTPTAASRQPRERIDGLRACGLW